MNPITGINPFEMLLLALLGGGFGGSMPPAPEDVVMSKMAAEECLFFTSWAAAAAPDGASANGTERMLAEPAVKKFMRQGMNSFYEMLLPQAAPNDQALQQLQKVQRLVGLIQGRAGAICLTDFQIVGEGVPDLRGSGLLRLDAAADEFQQLLEELQRESTAGITQETLGKYKFWKLQDEAAPLISWGVVKNYFLFGIGDDALPQLFRRLRTPAPTWLTELRSQVQVPRISNVVYFNAAETFQRATELMRQPGAAEQAATIYAGLGLDAVENFFMVSGLDEEGTVSRALFAMDGPGRGLLSWIDMASLTADDLAAVALESPAAVTFKLAAAELVEASLELARQWQPEETAAAVLELAGAENQIGINVRQDLLQPLGNTWRLYAQPGPTGLVTGWTLSAAVNDADKLRRVHDQLIQLAQMILAQEGPDAPAIQTSEMNGTQIFTLIFPGFVPVSPSWCVTEDQLLISATSGVLQQVLTHDPSISSLAESPGLAKLRVEEGGLLAVSYLDTPTLLRTLSPLVQTMLPAVLSNPQLSGVELSTKNLPPMSSILPYLQPSIAAVRRTDAGVEIVSHGTFPGGNLVASTPVLAALLLPAVQSARTAARSMSSRNNAKQIAIALHNYHDTYRHFPAAHNADESGRPLLSWRVHLLPFLEENALYEQFHLDEPWDSEHNKTLLPLIPNVYLSPLAPASEPDRTTYLGNGSEDGVFAAPEPGEVNGLQFRDLTDGTSNTVMVVEVNHAFAVEWTKPDDFVADAQALKKMADGVHPQGVHLLFADGSTRILSDEVLDLKTLGALLTKSGTEPVELSR